MHDLESDTNQPNNLCSSIDSMLLRIYELDKKGMAGTERTAKPIPAYDIMNFLETIRDLHYQLFKAGGENTPIDDEENFHRDIIKSNLQYEGPDND